MGNRAIPEVQCRHVLARGYLSGKHADSKAENLNQSGCSQLAAGTILSSDEVAAAHCKWTVVCLPAPEHSTHLEAWHSAVRGLLQYLTAQSRQHGLWQPCHCRACKRLSTAWLAVYRLCSRDSPAASDLLTLCNI